MQQPDPGDGGFQGESRGLGVLVGLEHMLPRTRPPALGFVLQAVH